jgi:hypothetical protein
VIKMKIGGVDYDEYVASIAQSQTINTQQTKVQTDSTESDKDSYIPSVVSADMVIPSGTYNSKGLEVGSNYYGTTSNDTTSQETQESQGGAGGVGGGGSSDSDEDTETEIVTINGVTYLQTTTTDENGNTTVTRTQIGTVAVSNE